MKVRRRARVGESGRIDVAGVGTMTDALRACRILPTMTQPIVEFPDPVVANYMERVLHLAPAARRHLDVHIREAMLQGAWITHPSLLVMSPIVWLRSMLFIRGAIRTADIAAEIEYRSFFAALRRQGWTIAGRGRVALGLILVRLRAANPEGALRAYLSGMDAFVPHRAIGWTEAAP
jgi:hypothetical protein